MCGSWEGPHIPHGDDGGFEYGHVFASFNRFVRWKLDALKPDLVIFEAPLPTVGRFSHAEKIKSTSHAVRILNGLVAFVEAAAHDNGIDCFEKSPQDIKFHFVGDRAAKKEAMLARCRQLRWKVANDDEADSAALWSLAKRTIDPHWNFMTGPLFEGKR
jgi:hypothetical protein